jgi:hypothetical protein
MRKPTIVITMLGAAAGLILASSAAAQAIGDPQRSSAPPPGLSKALARAVPGLLRALVATEGSNSRLQELPASP